MEKYLYKGREVVLQWGNYVNGNTAIDLINKNTGEQVVTVTVNIAMVDSNCIVVKNYSENTGVEDFLKEYGLVGEVVGEQRSGFVIVPVYLLTDKALKLREEHK